MGICFHWQGTAYGTPRCLHSIGCARLGNILIIERSISWECSNGRGLGVAGGFGAEVAEAFGAGEEAAGAGGEAGDG